MSNFYRRYLRDNNALQTISNMFRTYKKSCENFFKKEKIKRNQSEPHVAQQRCLVCQCKPKSEVDLVMGANDLCGNDWNNSRFDDNSSQESLTLTWSNSGFHRSDSNAVLSRNNHVDLNFQEKLNRMPIHSLEPLDDCRGSNIPLKRAYPWQNFNIGEDAKPKHEKVRDVENLTREMLKIRRSILRKSEAKSLNALKEVKFNRTALMMVYPKSCCGVMRQSRKNLCTNGAVPGVGRKRKLKEVPPPVNSRAVAKIAYYKKNAKEKEGVRKYVVVEPKNFWCFNKKQKIC